MKPKLRLGMGSAPRTTGARRSVARGSKPKPSTTPTGYVEPKPKRQPAPQPEPFPKRITPKPPVW